MKFIPLLLFVLTGLKAPAQDKNQTKALPAIICPKNASSQVRLAASELRRYIYLRTGKLLTISSNQSENCIKLV